MATNPYFNLVGATAGNENEQALVNDWVAESIQIFGMDVKYLPRTLQKTDTLYHEDVISSFDSNFTIEAYVESIEGFDGDGDLLLNFGLRIADQIELHMSQNRFRTETAMNKPMEGDLIYFPMTESLFEIKFVEHENQFYPNGTLPTFRLRCELFDYSGENLATGIPEVDAVDAALDANDIYDDNVDIENEALNVLDFTEQNPFGTPNQ